MDKTSPYMTTCRRGQSTCCREDTHRGPFIQRMEKPHPVWETQEVGKSSREAVGWVWFGRTDRVCGRILGVMKDSIGAKKMGLMPENCRLKGERIRPETKVPWPQDTSLRTEHGSFRQWALDCPGSNFCSSISSAKIKTNNITHSHVSVSSSEKWA